MDTWKTKKDNVNIILIAAATVGLIVNTSKTEYMKVGRQREIKVVDTEYKRVREVKYHPYRKYF